MTIEVKVPELPESVADATVLTWHKQPGEAVSRDEVLVELETDKVVLEVPAPDDGVLSSIDKGDGTVVQASELLGMLDTSAAAPAKKEESKSAASEAPAASASGDDNLTPAVRRLVNEKGLDPSVIPGTGKNGRVTKEDVLNYLKTGGNTAPATAATKPAAPAAKIEIPAGERTEKRVPMSRLRAKVAERLVQAQHSAAMLTTFNEVNLYNVMELRKKYKDRFEKAHGVRLGFMSFFTKAVVEALKRFPAVNASIDGNEIVYHGYNDIGIAVSTERGLVVPVLRNAENMSMADMEAQINDYALRARNNQLTIDEMTGGTFTITNGGVFGSLLATPIINPPQTGILGMHKIEERPIAENGQVVIRPMMYIALSYDHRLIDGKESVQFLATVKELLEEPATLILGL